MRILVALLVVLASCAHGSPVGEVRFKNQDPVLRVDDRVAQPVAPTKRTYNRTLYHTDGFFVRRATRALEMRGERLAQDINAIGDVPDSTWFTNRLGVRDLSLGELRRGPNASPDPFAHLPWTITGAKVGGMSTGFIVEDALGAKYILKFDAPNSPELETAADIIVQRILWAIGYNVPEDFVGAVARADLRIAPSASLTEAALDVALARVARGDDGRIRALASKLVPGRALGAYAREGTRSDDVNDLIPHEDRRSLRGQLPIFAWLNHTDMQEDNTLDAFVDGHVVHYLIDFGKALGVMGRGLRWRTVGHTYRFDPALAVRGLVTLGLAKRTWDGLEQPPYDGVGLIDVVHYDPGAWRPNSLYWPLEDADRFDAFWGAKLLVRFTREQLAAIVDEAKLSDPRAAAYLVDTLVARQRKTALYWFERVAPLDGFAVEPVSEHAVALAFTDLLLAHRLRDAATSYVIDTFDRRGGALGNRRLSRADLHGGVRVDDVPLAPDADGYTIVRIRVVRDGREMPVVVVHVARDVQGNPRVIGSRRR